MKDNQYHISNLLKLLFFCSWISEMVKYNYLECKKNGELA